MIHHASLLRYYSSNFRRVPDAGGAKNSPLLGVFLDEDFKIAPGLRSTLKQFVNDFYFGVVNVIPTGAGAKIKGTVAHKGTSFG